MGGNVMSHAAARLFATAVLAGLCFAVSPASAQMPPDIAAKIAALGRVVDPNATGAIYAPLQEKEPYAGIKVVRDVKYGPSERNVLDVFSADGSASSTPAACCFTTSRAAERATSMATLPPPMTTTFLPIVNL